MITLYEKESGKSVIFAHDIDAKESMRTGFYTKEDPTIVKPELPKKVEVTIPEMESKPIVVEKKVESTVVERKTSPVISGKIPIKKVIK